MERQKKRRKCCCATVKQFQDDSATVPHGTLICHLSKQRKHKDISHWQSTSGCKLINKSIFVGVIPTNKWRSTNRWLKINYDLWESIVQPSMKCQTTANWMIIYLIIIIQRMQLLELRLTQKPHSMLFNPMLNYCPPRSIAIYYLLKNTM